MIPVQNKGRIFAEDLEEMVCLPIIRIIRDVCCFWHAIMQWLDDPERAKSYEGNGELQNPNMAKAETEAADKLKDEVLDCAKSTGIIGHAESDPKVDGEGVTGTTGALRPPAVFIGQSKKRRSGPSR